MNSSNGPLRIGIGGPVGSGKTTLTQRLCEAMRDDYSIGVVTNDIYILRVTEHPNIWLTLSLRWILFQP